MYLSITSIGLENTGVHFSVRDDTGDSSYIWNDQLGTTDPYFSWVSCCTDGAVISGLPNNIHSNWSINVTFNDYSGLDQSKVRSLSEDSSTINSFSIPASFANSLTISKVSASAAPEPAPVVLFLFSMSGLFLMRRHTRQLLQVA